MYWNDLDRHEGGKGVEEIWMSHPLVRAAINRRVSGSEHEWPLEWLARRLAAEIPFASAVTIGCGTGALERDLVAKRIVTRVVGLDIAPAPLDRARELAAAAGFADRIAYERAEARAYLEARPESFDAVFFQSSLHHFDRPIGILTSVSRALTQRGVLCFDEYVGPSRGQWNPLRLLPMNVAYYLLPRGTRRPRIVRAPVNHDDPTEAVASDEILPAVGRLFEIVERRDYGGNLLSVVYPNLRRPEGDRREFDAAVARLIRLEEAMLKVPGVRSYSSVVVARRRER